jgi:predicted AAA+ superfamily ATPase
MCNANVINEINYYDVKGKRLLKTNSKYYSLDLGIIGSVNGFNKNFG